MADIATFVREHFGEGLSILALAISLFSYRQVTSMKTLDLRVEVRRTRHEADSNLTAVEDFKRTAMRSRTAVAVAAAIGLSQSGAMVKWKVEWEEDQKQIDLLRSQLAAVPTDLARCNPTTLEQNLAELQGIMLKLDGLVAKYTKAMQWDDNQRDQRRADLREHLNRLSAT